MGASQAGHRGERLSGAVDPVRPDPGQGSGPVEEVAGCGPKAAALTIGFREITKKVSQLLLSGTGWNYPEHLIRRGVRSIDEVANVSLQLGAKAPRLLGAAIPFQVKQDLTVVGQKATPSVWRGPVLVGLGVGGEDLVLTDPVVEAEVSSAAAGEGEADEELVGLQLVDEVEAASKSILGALDERSWVLVAPFPKQRCPPPSNEIDGRAADPARSRGGAPAC